jgi:hypothetical protein
MRRLATGFAVLLGGALLACSGSTLGRQTEEPVQLTVLNNRFEDATIHALWKGGAKRRVGVVTGMTSKTFSFEWVSDEVRFEVDFLAAGDYTVEPIQVSAGDHLDLVILNTRP